MHNTEWFTPAVGAFDERRRPTWWLRRCFDLKTVPASLTLDVVCLGYYQLYVNGEQVGDEPLAPSVSKLDARGFVLHHDLHPYLREGRNCIGIWCSSGWYLPHQFAVHEDASPLLRVTLSENVEYDGEWLCREANRQVLDKWDWNRFGGEEVDARAALPEWNRVDCDVSEWHPVKTVSAPPIEISERTCPPNRIGATYEARSLRTLEDGRYEIDFGICLSGWVDLNFPDLEPGRKLTLRFYDLPADNQRQRDHSYNQVSIYHGRGDGADRFVNKFNYAGFRYMTIDGLTSRPELSDMRALLVESAMDRAGHFRCSNDLYNRIHDMNLQTLRCLNQGGYSVDCPHRERNGYGADGQAALPAYLYLLDSQAFLRKWLTDWCDVYETDTGRIPMTAPPYHHQFSPAWGGIVAPLAWALYLYYGEREAMAEALPVIEGYLRFLQNAVVDGVMRKERIIGEKKMYLGDWVPPRRGMDTENTPDLPMREFFNSCYLIYLWQTYLRICEVLRKDDYREEAETNIATLRRGIHREFYDTEQGLYLLPEQVYQAMPLMTGVVPPELVDSVKSRLVGLIEAQGWHLDSGLPGTTLLIELLTELGEHELLGRVYAQETYPGFGYMLASGATTIWEQWNGFWSQIHSCFAGPAVWFYQGLAGIKPDASGPGFKSFTLAPAFLDDIAFVDAAYESANGRIESAWRREDNMVTWRVTIPDGCTAQLQLPSGIKTPFKINGEPFSKSTFTRGDGAYTIVFDHAPSTPAP